MLKKYAQSVPNMGWKNCCFLNTVEKYSKRKRHGFLLYILNMQNNSYFEDTYYSLAIQSHWKTVQTSWTLKFKLFLAINQHTSNLQLMTVCLAMVVKLRWHQKKWFMIHPQSYGCCTIPSHSITIQVLSTGSHLWWLQWFAITYPCSEIGSKQKCANSFTTTVVKMVIKLGPITWWITLWLHQLNNGNYSSNCGYKLRIICILSTRVALLI